MVRFSYIGLFTQYVRANNIKDEVEAALVKTSRKAAMKNKKAKAQAKKMEAVDVALNPSLAESTTDLAEEIATFDASKTALRTFLQDQYRSRHLLHGGIYDTIPTVSEFRIHILNRGKRQQRMNKLRTCNVFCTS